MSLISQLESLLFISNRPFTVKQLSELTEGPKEEVMEALAKLKEKYAALDSGLTLTQIDQEYQFVSAAQNSSVVSKFVKEETTSELTTSQLEALTVIAYRGPISKAELELIRGVNCTLILRNLMIRGLVECDSDKKNGIVQYNITFDFLKHLGLGSVSELPDYEKFRNDENLKKLLAQTPVEEDVK